MTSLLNQQTMLILLVLAVAGVAVFRLLASGSRQSSVQQKPLMTKAEQQFMTKLELALPQYRVLAQVAMGALLQPHSNIKDHRKRTRARWSYAQKIVDFVIADRHSADIIALVELDDNSHDNDRDARRDKMLESAGYKVVRFSNGRYVGVADIKEAFAIVVAA